MISRLALGKRVGHLADQATSRFQRNGGSMSFIREFWHFLKQRRKFWLYPILIVALLFGGLIILTEGSAIAPFIYTLY
jgi:hypothetical protein